MFFQMNTIEKLGTRIQILNCFVSASIQFLNKLVSKSQVHSKYYFHIILYDYNEHIQQKALSENTKTKLGVMGLAALPVVAAMYSSGSMALEQVPQILTSGVFPIGFTVFSWAIAAKMALKLRK